MVFKINVNMQTNYCEAPKIKCLSINNSAIEWMNTCYSFNLVTTVLLIVFNNSFNELTELKINRQSIGIQ